jgi:hypothetical protein
MALSMDLSMVLSMTLNMTGLKYGPYHSPNYIKDIHRTSLGYRTFKRWPMDVYRISCASWVNMVLSMGILKDYLIGSW